MLVHQFYYSTTKYKCRKVYRPRILQGLKASENTLKHWMHNRNSKFLTFDFLLYVTVCELEEMGMTDSHTVLYG